MRPARAADGRATAELFAAVAEERDGIATEPPVDIDQRAAQFARSADASIVAVADGRIIGGIHVEVSRFGFGEIGMDGRSRLARSRGGHGEVVAPRRSTEPRAGPAQALPGGVPAQHGGGRPVRQVRLCRGKARRVKQYRRANGELWDSIVMGLLL